MKTATKTKIYFDFLYYVQDVCKVSGQIESLSKIAEKYGASKNHTGIACQNLGILKQISKGVYQWSSSQAPSVDMAGRIIDEIRKITSAANKKWLEGKNATKKEETRNLTPVSEIKEQAKIEARTQLIKASQAASVLGVNLLDMSEKKIEEFINKID